MNKTRDIVDVGTTQIRKFYEKYYSKKPSERIKPKMFMNILEDYHERVVEDIIFESKIFYLPYNLGAVYLTKRRPKVEFDENFNITRTTAGIDFKSMNELWASDPEAKANKTKVYYQNDHSDNYSYSFTWSRKRVSVAGIGVYRFLPARPIKRALAKKIKGGDISC